MKNPLPKPLPPSKRWISARRFVLQRDVDVTGVSGTGIVAEGVQFSNGKVVVQWIVGTHQSTVVWDHISSVLAIHGHDEATRLIWED